MGEWRRHIEEVERKLLKELITAIEADKVKQEEIPPMANLVLQKIDAASYPSFGFNSQWSNPIK